MNSELVLQMIGGAGFLAGVAAIFHFFNTRRATRTKGSAEAYQAYREFTEGAFDDRDRELARVMARRDALFGVRDTLVALVQDLIKLARSKGATASEIEHFQDRLDDVRRV